MSKKLNKKIRLYIVVSFILFCTFLVGCQKKEPNFPQHTYSPVQESFVTRKELGTILSQSSKKPDFQGAVLGGAVPHHLVAGRLIKDFMEVLSKQEPELIILVGPNHYNLGGKIITGLYAWQTPEGPVRADEQLVNMLLDENIAVRDEEVLAKEHSIGNLMPFIRHFSPQARVVPLIFHHDVSLAEVDSLLDLLVSFLDERQGVIVASVDFSHYLTRVQAQEKDSFTLEVMRNFDYPTLFHLGNDHLDSPASLAAAFRYAERKGIRKFQVLANTNSGVILKNDLEETTSYFTLVFPVKNKTKKQ